MNKTLKVERIDPDLCLIVSFAVGYIMENCDLSDTAHVKLKGISNSLRDWISSSEGNNDSPDQVLDELISNIESIQEKIEAYDDLEYSEEELSCNN